MINEQSSRYLVLLSGNNSNNYLAYWPLVATAWRKIFGFPAHLSLIANEGEVDVEYLRLFGDVHVLEPIPDIPISSQAKLGRFFAACSRGDTICIIQDLDLIPLQSDYLNQLLEKRIAETILCVGHECYQQTIDNGKFPLGYTTAEGRIFREIWNPDDLDWAEFVGQFRKHRVIDNKEDVLIKLPPGDSSTFSDESLFRALLAERWDDKKLTRVSRGFSEYSEKAIDRSAWEHWSKDKLTAGGYVECHGPHPYNAERLTPITDYLAATYGVDIKAAQNGYKMRHLVVGLGQIGASLTEVLKEQLDWEVCGVDISDTADGLFDVLHICMPYTDEFIASVRSYITRYLIKRGIVVIHSTVPAGTTEQCGYNAVHSPMRGVHPHLTAGIKTFVKYFGGPKAEEAASMFELLGITCVSTPSAVTTELLKLWDTTIYAVNVLLEKAIWKHCQDAGADFSIAYTDACETYNDGYRRLGRPEFSKYILEHMPGPIGGHCLLPNAQILAESGQQLAQLVVTLGKSKES